MSPLLIQSRECHDSWHSLSFWRTNELSTRHLRASMGSLSPFWRELYVTSTREKWLDSNLTSSPSGKERDCLVIKRDGRLRTSAIDSTRAITEAKFVFPSRCFRLLVWYRSRATCLRSKKRNFDGMFKSKYWFFVMDENLRMHVLQN